MSALESSQQIEWYIRATAGGFPVVQFTTFLEMKFKSGAALPIMPVADGAFFTANKWAMPYNALVRGAVAGDNYVLNHVMIMLERYKREVDLVDIVTPYYALLRGNIYDIDYEFDNDQTGVGMIIPTISIQEIRLVRKSVTSMQDTAKLRLAKNAESDSTTENGKVTEALTADTIKDFGLKPGPKRAAVIPQEAP